MRNLLLAYFAAALITFGHSASGNTGCKQGLFTSEQLAMDCIAFRAYIAGMAWPLYWSWSAFAAVRAALETDDAT